MKYATAPAFRLALEERLRQSAGSAGVPLDILRKRIVFDQLLARLLRSAPDAWRLKGALALNFRLAGRSRFTRDLDLLHRRGEDRAQEDLRSATQLDLGDFFVLEVERIGTLGAEEAGEQRGVRYGVRARLAGRFFEEIRVDVVFTDPLEWEPDKVPGAGLLAFADFPRIEVPVLPLPQHVAEKVHALTRVYGGARPSSRVKDLVDLNLISTFDRTDACALQVALAAIFQARATHPVPERLPDPPRAWAPAYHELAGDAGLERDLDTGSRRVCRWINPVLAGAGPGMWDPEHQVWRQPA